MCRIRWIRLAHCAARVAVPILTGLLVLAVPAAALGLPVDPGGAGHKSLPEVIASLQSWIMGILAAVATLFLVLAGVYWTTAGGDPVQVDKAKAALRNALVGYALAVLAPVLLEVAKNIVGG